MRGCNDPNCGCNVLAAVAERARASKTPLELFTSATAHLACSILREMLMLATEAEAEAILAVCQRTTIVRFEIPPSPLPAQMIACMDQALADLKPDTDEFIGAVQRTSQFHEVIASMAPTPEAKA